MRQIGGAELWSSHDPHLQVGDPQIRMLSQLWRSSTRSKVLAAHIGSPAWGSCTRKTSIQNVWLWKPVGLIFGKAGGLGNRESTLKACVQNLTFSKSQHRDSSLKGDWVRSICWSWRASHRGWRQLLTPPGDGGAGRSHFWGSHSTMLTSTLASAILESSLWPISRATCSTHQRACSNHMLLGGIAIHMGRLPYLEQPHDGRKRQKTSQKKEGLQSQTDMGSNPRFALFQLCCLRKIILTLCASILLSTNEI